MEPEEGALGLAVAVDQQILLRKQPVPAFSPADALEDLHTNLFMMAFQPCSAGSFTSDSAQPFRYREWVFSTAGPVPSQLVSSDGPLFDSLPSFLDANHESERSGSVLFSYFMGGFYEEGLLDAKGEQSKLVLQALSKGMLRFREKTGMQAIPFSFTLMRRDFAVGFIGETGVQRLDLRGNDPDSSEEASPGVRRVGGLKPYVKKLVLASTEKELPAPWTRLEPMQVFLLGKDASWTSRPAFA